MRPSLFLFAVLLLPLLAQAEDWDLVYFDQRNVTSYRLDRDSVMRKSDGNLYAMVVKVNLPVEVACAKRDSGGCQKDSDPADCDRVTEKLCPGGNMENYKQFILWELTCAGQIKKTPTGISRTTGRPSVPVPSKRRSKQRSAGDSCRCHPHGPS